MRFPLVVVVGALLCALHANGRNVDATSRKIDSNSRNIDVMTNIFNSNASPPIFTTTVPKRKKKLPVCKEKNTCRGHDCNYWLIRGWFNIG